VCYVFKIHNHNLHVIFLQCVGLFGTTNQACLSYYRATIFTSHFSLSMCMCLTHNISHTKIPIISSYNFIPSHNPPSIQTIPTKKIHFFLLIFLSTTMATTITEQESSSRASHVLHYTPTPITTSDEEEEEEEEEHLEGNENEPTGAGWRSTAECGGDGRRTLGKVLDPRAKWVQEWNRVFLLVCAAGLFVDPLFFYALSVSDSCMCVFVDGWLAVTVTVLRCMTDALHLWNMVLRMKMAKRTFGLGAAAGLRDTRPRTVALGYLKSRTGFIFDLFVILPLPQVNHFFLLLLLMTFYTNYPNFYEDMKNMQHVNI